MTAHGPTGANVSQQRRMSATGPTRMAVEPAVVPPRRSPIRNGSLASVATGNATISSPPGAQMRVKPNPNDSKTASPTSEDQHSRSRQPKIEHLTATTDSSFSAFMRKHEVPRKALHLSIGLLSSGLYLAGVQPAQVSPVLLGLLVPITVVDLTRLRSRSFNQFYIRYLGPFMRESEAGKINGVIYFLAGSWAVTRFAPKDVAVLSVMLLSWCDTAASTVGRQWGRHTRSIRQGKSLAGSAAALVTGIATAAFFYGVLAPRGTAAGFDSGENTHAFKRLLHFSLPRWILSLPGLSTIVESDQSGGSTQSVLTLSGSVAVAVASVWAGLVATASEAVDLFGLDDNLTIPVICGVGIWGFFKIFG